VVLVKVGTAAEFLTAVGALERFVVNVERAVIMLEVFGRGRLEDRKAGSK
jgi:hypothetical protein